MKNYLKIAAFITVLLLAGIDPAELVAGITATAAQRHNQIETATSTARAPTTAVHSVN